MPFKTTQERAKKHTVITQWLQSCKDGDRISWLEAEYATKIEMDNDGKALVRQAIKRAGREYETEHGKGFILCSPDNACAIMGQKLAKVGRATNRAHRSHGRLTTRHLAAMSEPDKKKMLHVGSLFGALKSMASSCTVRMLTE